MWRVKLALLRWLVREFPPKMTPLRTGEWIFIDHYQQLWRIRYTGQHDIPFSINLLER